MSNTVSEISEDSEMTVEAADLETALASANFPTLIGVLAHATGDDKWLSAPYQPRRARGLDDNDDGGLSADVRQEIISAVLDVVGMVDAGTLVPEVPSPARITRILGAVLDESVPDEYGELLAEELGVRSREVTLTRPPKSADFSVCVIGAGMSGIAAAIALQDSGVDFDVIEKNPGVGGTWLENIYPGCGVDTPSSLYSYSFALKRDWTRYFAKRDEVEAYFAAIATERGIARNVHFGLEVVSATYDDDQARWTVVVRDGNGAMVARTYSAVITAVGQVNRPFIPTVAGVETFRGQVVHTAAWDESLDITGKSVVVIGTGASAMQLVPAIAASAGQVTIIQRSRQWAIPHPNYARQVADALTVVNERVPFYTQWYRLRAFWNFGDRLHDSLQIDHDWPHGERSINEANERHRVFLTNYITEQLRDRTDLLESAIPHYPPYLKRPLIDNGWFEAIKRDNVELLEAAVGNFTPEGIVTTDGAERHADVVVFATGFNILQFLAPMEIRGKSGVTLAEAWGPDDARAYLGVTVPDFPNLFILNGPNTFAGHGGSAILATEFQLRYALQGIERLASGAAKSVEVRRDVFDAYNQELDAALDAMIWSHRGATNYFRNDAGRIVVNSPWKYVDYWRRTLAYDEAEYVERS